MHTFASASCALLLCWTSDVSAAAAPAFRTIELDPETLAAIKGAREDSARRQVDQTFAGLLPATDLTFALYRNGSAFLHAPT